MPFPDMQPVPLCDCGKPRRARLRNRNGFIATCGDTSCIKARQTGGPKGVKLSPEHRQRIIESNLGRVNTKATREKMSQSALKRYENHSHKNNYKPMSRVHGEKMPREHRVVMEEKMMRLLKPKELVHHWDENRRNNHPDNLALMRQNAAHLRLHAFARRHGIPMKDLKFDQPWLDYEAQFQSA